MMLPLLFLMQDHAEEAEHAAGALPAPFSPTPGLFIWTIIVFAVLLFMLRKLVFPILVKATVEREQQINNQLAEAARLQDEAKAVLEEQRQMLAGARGEGQAIIAEARANAAQWSTRIPDAIRLSVLKTGVMIRVSGKKAPHARPYEGIGTRRQTFRHPVFGDREHWVEQNTRPFLMPAVRNHAREVRSEVVRTIDQVLRLHGYR